MPRCRWLFCGACHAVCVPGRKERSRDVCTAIRDKHRAIMRSGLISKVNIQAFRANLATRAPAGDCGRPDAPKPAALGRRNETPRGKRRPRLPLPREIFPRYRSPMARYARRDGKAVVRTRGRWTGNRDRDGRVHSGRIARRFMTGIRSAVCVSSAEYLPVRNVTRTSHPHIAHGYDARPEGDVAFDLEPATAAQRRRPGREPLLEAGQ
jgi:hypothetical protein